MQKKFTKWLQSIRRSQVGLTPSLPTPQPSPEDIPSYSVFQECRTLPFDIFLDILIDSKVERLTISGEPPREALIAAWRVIYSEYASLTETQESKQAFKGLKRMRLLQSQIEKAEMILAVLQGAHHPKLVDYLRSLDINLPFDPSDHEGYVRDLSIASNMVKRWYHDLKIMEGELEPGKAGKKLDRAYFDDLLFQISKFSGYAIRPKEITVAEYAAAFRAYTEQIRILNSQSMKYGRAS